MATAVATPASLSPLPPAVPETAAATPRTPSQLFARDAVIAWFQGEFAAANAIIDALCGHLAQISDGSSDYDAAFAAIHRRRLNWAPVLHMQRYFSISDVTAELRRAAARRRSPAGEEIDGSPRLGSVEESREMAVEMAMETTEASAAAVKESAEYACSRDATDRKGGGSQETGFQVGQDSSDSAEICTNHEDCMARPDSIKILKGFVAKEPVKGHMVNVVKGLKVYEDIFTTGELLKLTELINELRLAGRRGELSGETFIYFNKQIKGNKREIIQLGVPLFQPTKEEETSNIEPIPPVLQTAINRLVQWHLIPESRMPNCCIINFFDEDEYSQPYFKPPHLDNHISTLLLSETTVAFGRVLVSDPHGNYKGSLKLSLKEGSLLIMRGNSADMARHVVCPSSNRRVSITFVKVRPTNNQIEASLVPPLAKATTLWQPVSPPQQKVSSGRAFSCAAPEMIPSWGAALRTPVLMLAPPRPIVMSTGRKVTRSSGTGVFLPWTVGPKKYTKHLPPRIQKRRLSS